MSLFFLDDTPEFVRLVKALDQKAAGKRIGGVVDAAKPFFLEALTVNTNRTVVLIRPLSASLSELEEECRFYAGLRGREFKSGILPALSDNPYNEIPPSLESISYRMKFFRDLRFSLPDLIVTHLPGLIKPFPSHENLKNLFLELEINDSAGRDRVLETLLEFGYVKEDLVNSAGEMAWRGGVIDVYSPWEAYPFRIEFSGERIASIRTFDPSNQRSMIRLKNLILPSLREFPATRRFFEEWKDLAFKASGRSRVRDLEEKITRLDQGNVFPSFSYLALLHKEHFVSFQEYLKDCLYIIEEFDEVEREWNTVYSETESRFRELKKNKLFGLDPEFLYAGKDWESVKQNAFQLNHFVSSPHEKTLDFLFQSVPRFDNRIPFFIDYLKKLQRSRERCLLFFSGRGVKRKLGTLLSQHQIRHTEYIPATSFPRDGAVALLTGKIERGFSYPPQKITVFSERDIFTEEKVIISRRPIRRFLSYFQDLKACDYVVHTDYGIGVFNGLVKMAVDDKDREFIEILYKDNDRLFVPVEDLNLVQKYSFSGTSAPALNKLGTSSWEKLKTKTKKAIENMARDLLQLYAKRKTVKGIRFSHGGEWQEEFSETFEYEETEDQLRAIEEIMGDMESTSPMDRLLCGDVGYGKTEVAIRAAFKAIMDGYQVAVLCPTTVLASQHVATFKKRMMFFPIQVEMLSRLQTSANQKKIVSRLADGSIDIIIGTHRLLSKDIRFFNLGLLIVDEEQRFGVNHKEKIKKMKANIDVLAMTATPIPRTLNLSLSGIRDMSLIETPPKDRLAIHTVVTMFDIKLVASAVEKELSRGGQVYFIHNRIEDIDKIASMINKHVPSAEVAVIHGRMPALELERRMLKFIHNEYNVLVSTTIIENGIDIPLVNTLIVNRADLFGLAQLYQLRGRVGRSSRQAVAYFLVPPHMEMTPLARKRLKALQEFSQLGSGFRLAAKDLEIRGAGNFLGAEQHGYMEAVGFDYYMILMEQAVKRLKGEEIEEVKCEINLKVDIRIPEEYLPQINLRLNLYKKVSSIQDPEDLEKIKEEISDRYGPLPESFHNLLLYGYIKFLAQKIRIASIDRLGNRLLLKLPADAAVNSDRLPDLLKKEGGSITPQGVMSLNFFVKQEKDILDETLRILKELSIYNIINSN
ncbi:MAG: transcription-repair coupling factor [Candidatus Aminicenantes bacterium]|nr:transcription-repair coupling factor [Candidatus Aminicenantes bacterium]